MINDNSFTIQQAEFEDLKEILNLQKVCYREEAELYNDFTIPPLIQSIKSIEKDFEDQVFLKCVISGELAGSVRAEILDGSCKIGRLIVAEKYRRRGIGRKLMDAIENLDKFIKRFELFTGHLSSRNLALYEKLGYMQFKIKEINPKLRLVFMEKLNHRDES